MKVKQLNEPYVIEMGEADGELVQITIRAVDGGKLGYDEIRESTRQILDFARREFGPRVSTMSVAKRSNSEAVRQMVAAYNAGHGRVSDEYLARLAVAYEELAPQGRGVSLALTGALGSKLQTVKGHIMRARREGFLTEAVEGREGGEATDKARKLIESLPKT